MEAAHRYFDRYVFAMTTIESATRGLSTIDSEGEPSAILEEPAIWVLLCQHVTDVNQECLYTNYRNPMELENFITFLEHLDLADWVELPDAKSTASDVYDSRGLHLILLVYDLGVRQKVLELAPELGLRFKGIAGVVVLNINNFTPDDLRQIGFQPENLKPPCIGFKAHGQTKVAVINEYDNAYQFVVEQLKHLFGSQDLQQNVFELVEELDELQQDDEVALAVQSGNHADHSKLLEVNDKSFQDFVKSRLVTAVLFYLHWDPVSQVALNVFSKAAEFLIASKSVVLGRMDCFDWTDVCDKENISAFPIIKVFRQNRRMSYQPPGLEVTALLTSLMLFQQNNPVLLEDQKDLDSFLQGKLTLPRNETPLVFPSLLVGKRMDDYAIGTAVEKVGQEFHGLLRIGICDEAVCIRSAQKYNVEFPFAIMYKPNDVFENHVIMTNYISSDTLTSFIEMAYLEAFPQLTEYNFAPYRKEDKPLGILFMQREIHEDIYTSVGQIAAANKHLRFGWMDITNNVTQAVKTALSPDTRDDEVTLVIADYKKGCVYQYNEISWHKTNLQQWIDAINEGKITPSNMLPSGNWKPRLPGFDYLKFIDQDQVREEDKYVMDVALDDLGEFHQSRLFRLPGSSDKRLRMKPRDETETQHQHFEL